MTKVASHTSAPARLAAHPRSGWISFLLFQGVMLVFCGVLVLSVGKMMPGTFPDTPEGRAWALRLGIYLSLPVAIAGTVAGLAALVQSTHRRLLGVIGTSLNGAYVLLCLIILR